MNNYFYLKAIEIPSTVRLIKPQSDIPNIKYSKDGKNWEEWDGKELVIKENTKMYFKGNNGTQFSKYRNSYSTFDQFCGGKVVAGGNIMSLLDDGDCTSLKVGNYCFCKLFNDFINLDLDDSFVLPATTLGYYCYESMFQGCASLTTAPVLPATTLASSCYNSMFYGCRSLSNVTCLAEDISALYCTKEWLYGVASTGTFTKSGNMNKWVRGANGIPDGWRI